MQPFLDLLAAHPLLLLFAVVAVGYPVGRLKVAGASLGLSALLFAGMAFGVMDPRLRLPEPLTQFGLAVFLYCLGLASAPGFFAAFHRGTALRQNLLALGALGAGTAACLLLARVAGLNPLEAAGLFSGSGANASALAAVMDQGRGLAMGRPGDAAVAYALSFPAGILGPMLAFVALQRWFKVDLAAEAAALPGYRPPREALEAWTFRVTREEAEGLTKRGVIAAIGARVAMGRILRKAEFLVPTSDTRLLREDLVVFVGGSEELKAVEALLGERSPHEIDRRGLEAFEDFRFFVSNAALVGRPLRELRLPSLHGAIVSRVRRGDQVFVATGDTVLELGDRVRVVARREQRTLLAGIFGDSYKASSEGDFLALSLGLAAGLALGLVPIPLPGGLTFHLGISGGPLLVGLVLGRFTRLGRWTFTVPYATSLALRQLGLVVFLAGAGTVAGASLPRIAGPTLLVFLGLGIVVAGVVSLVVLWWGHRHMGLSLNELGGVLAGAQTQSALLDFASAQTRNELPAQSYAVVYPLATVLKVVLAQLLLLWVA